MSVTHGQILQTAIDLSGLLQTDGTCCESNLRSATSRAYYAALHAAITSLPSEFSPKVADLKGASSHEIINDAITLWGKSMIPGRTEAQILARGLPVLKKLRKKADYQIDSEFLAEETKDALLRATKLIASAERARFQYDARESA